MYVKVRFYLMFLFFVCLFFYSRIFYLRTNDLFEFVSFRTADFLLLRLVDSIMFRLFVMRITPSRQTFEYV